MKKIIILLICLSLFGCSKTYLKVLGTKTVDILQNEKYSDRKEIENNKLRRN